MSLGGGILLHASLTHIFNNKCHKKAVNFFHVLLSDIFNKCFKKVIFH